MQIAMIGLGRMGANMVRRLLSAEHACVVFTGLPANLRQKKSTISTAGPAAVSWAWSGDTA